MAGHGVASARAGVPYGHWKTTIFVAGLRLTAECAHDFAAAAYDALLIAFRSSSCRNGDFEKKFPQRTFIGLIRKFIAFL